MSSAQDIEFGLDSFVPLSLDEAGHELSGDVVIRNTVEEAVLADAVGIDSFNIAEHYRPEMMDSAASIILATIAGRTKRIRLGTAVTVLSTQDPVRVYTEFATLDAVSNGRAQLIAGRGSLIESFPLFGYDLNDYEDLFEEKLDLLTRLLRDQPVTWSGRFRSPLTNQYLSPPLPEGHLPTWVAVGRAPPLRPPADACRHRRSAEPVRTAGRALQTSPRQVRVPAAADRHAFPRVRGQNGQGSHRYSVAALGSRFRERGGRARMGAADHGSTP